MEFPKEVTINEMVLRDGLQLEKKIVSVEEKKLLFSTLTNAGVKSFEFGSFVHPKLVPQMANSGEFFREIADEELDLIALVPNLKGAELAKESGVKRINFVFSASDTHNMQNVHKTTAESIAELRRINDFCDQNEMVLHATVATSFGCPFEGAIPEERILSIVNELLDFTINQITLADTTGMANPKQVFDLLKEVKASCPEQHFNLHFHNTRGMGLSNILAGLQAGVTSFDAALGGLGGCPFAPGATGNVCTEDVVHMLQNMGIQTNIRLDGLLKASAQLETIIGHPNNSYLLKAGPSDRKYAVPISN